MDGSSSSQLTLVAFILAILTVVETVDAFGQAMGALVLFLIAGAWLVFGISSVALYRSLYGIDDETN